MNPKTEPRWQEILDTPPDIVWSELYDRQVMLAANWEKLNPSVRAMLIRQQVKKLGQKMLIRFVKGIRAVLGEPQTGQSDSIFAYLDADPDLQGRAALWAHETIFPAAEPEPEPEPAKKGRRKK